MVVSILTVRQDYRQGEPSLSVSSGSGTVVSAQGHIATNAHVTQNGKSFRVVFANGNTLDIESRGELLLTRTATDLRLTARISREEYVARVLDREATPEPVEAARALAIAIRSYLQQNARRDGDCLRIDSP